MQQRSTARVTDSNSTRTCTCYAAHIADMCDHCDSSTAGVGIKVYLSCNGSSKSPALYDSLRVQSSIHKLLCFTQQLSTQHCHTCCAVSHLVRRNAQFAPATVRNHAWC
eukprot:18260-Heterococcus_DN1.PRE.4